VSSDELKQVRDKLDALDKSIVDALAARDRLVEEVAHLKSDPNRPVRDLSREEALLGKVADHAESSGVNRDLVTRLFREIMDHSLRRQHRRLAQGDAKNENAVVRIAYQGTNGSYSNQTAAKHFASADFEVELLGFPNFKQAIDAVANGTAEYGVLPVENTTAGSINETYDLLGQYDLHQIGEEIHRIEHCLMAVEPVPLSRIRRIYSQPQALAQCTEFLDSLDHCQAVSFTDTAMACQKIQQDQNLTDAAIASEEAGRIYGLHVIKRNVANQKDNYTRFAVISKTPVEYDLRIPCKTSVILATRHEKGALLECLTELAKHGLNLTKLESRPRPNVPWQYLFYLDFEGNLASENVQEALVEVKAFTSYMKVLGSYPSRTTEASAPAVPKRSSETKGRTTKPRTDSISDEIRQDLEKKPYVLASRAKRSADTVIKVGNFSIGGGSRIVLAGPAGLDEKELRSFAENLKELGGGVLAVNCFTHAAAASLSYSEALNVLSSVGQDYGLPTMTEVSHPDEIDAAKGLIGILQVSSRNMQNYALLHALGKVDRPILLRRGMMASLDEWLSAAEVILAQGNQQVILCERGIKTFETSTRGTLDLTSIPIVRERSHLPVIVDPTDACGQSRWIPALAQASVFAGAHGVMIETTHQETSQRALTLDKFNELVRTIRDD